MKPLHLSLRSNLRPQQHYYWKDEVSPGDAFGIQRVRQAGQDPNAFKHIHTHHGHVEVFWVESGRGTHFVQGKEVALEAGDLVMVRPWDVHTTLAAAGQELVFVNLTFPLKTLAKLKKRWRRDIPDFFQLKSPMPFHCKMPEALAKWLDKVTPSLVLGGRREFDLDAFLFPFFHDLYFPPLETSVKLCPEWLQEAHRLIQKPEHFTTGIHQFEWLAGRSREHVARETKKWFGKTPSELVNQLRLEFAASKLAFSDAKITRIAASAGFKSLSSFYELFEDYFGLTPRNYRLRRELGLQDKSGTSPRGSKRRPIPPALKA